MKAINKLQLAISALCLLVLIGAVGVCGTLAMQNKITTTEVASDAVSEETSTDATFAELEYLIAYQTQVDLNLQAALADTSYTPLAPYVELNPYSNAPLSAVLIFNTEEECSVYIEIQDGLDEASGDSYSFSEFTTEHVIPVYGLYADTYNLVYYALYDANETLLYENTVSIQTGVLADGYENLIINAFTMDEESYTEGVTFCYTSNTIGEFAIDQNGELRWCITISSLAQSSERVDNHFILATEDDQYMVEYDKLGKIYAVYYLEYGAHHDIEEMPNGNYLITGSTGDTVEDFIYEIDPDTGEVVNTLDLKEVFSRYRMTYTVMSVAQRDGTDWFHHNSIDYVEEDDCIIISSNFQSMIAKISWPDGEIEWILGDDYEWMTYYEQFLLTPIGDDFEYTYNQHAAYILPDLDDDPNTIDITVFDNGNARYLVDEKYHDAEATDDELYSRMVHYRIYQDTMEVEQIFEYGTERGEELYSIIRGDTDYLEETGNYLGTFDRWQTDYVDGFAPYPALVEVDSDGNVIWEAELFTNSATGYFNSYQSERITLYFDTETYQDITTAVQFFF